jgi:elongation factor G
MKKAMLAGDIVPLFCGSGELQHGVRALLTEIVELLPSPAEVSPPVDASLVGRAFKTVSEPHVGDVSLFRIYRGSIKNGDEVWNAEHNVAEKLNHLSVQQGRERQEVGEIHAGDIGSVAKLKDTHTGDTFCRRDKPVRLPPMEFPEAEYSSAVVVKQRGEEDKLAGGLHKLHEEDPTFHFEYNSELGQTLIHGMGERHLEILLSRLTRKYGVHAELVRPKVAYRETFKGTAEGQGKHKKQSGGRGQYGDCWIRIAPQPRGTGYEFVDKIVGGVIPNKFIPAVDKGIQEAAARGPIAGYPCVDFRVECYDGSYHDVDSSEQAFKMAGILAFRNVTPKARPVLLEPIMTVAVWTPSDMLGDVLGDLSPRRAHILSTDTDGRLTKVNALVPQSELYRYSTSLHSITHGRGRHTERFHGYAEAPGEVANKVSTEHKKELVHVEA